MGTDTNVPTPPPATTAWWRFRAWVRRHNLVRHVEIGLVIAALTVGTLTYFAMTPGATDDLSPREVQILLLTDLAVLMGLTTLLARRLVMLWMQRRRGAAGSRLHARMVVLFSAVAALPTVLMTLFAVLFFNLGLQTWFSERVSTAVKGSVAMAEAYTREHRNAIVADILAVAVDLNREAPRVARNPLLLQQVLQSASASRGLSEAIVVTSAYRVLARSGLSFTMDIEAIPPQIFQEAAQGRVMSLAAESEDRVRAFMRLDAYVDTYLHVGRVLNASVLAELARTRAAAAQYSRLEAARSALEINFAVLFILVSLLLLFAAIWFGLQIATRLVTPIGEVVSAAERIRGGDLQVRVYEREDDDEVANLGRAFNRMTSQLVSQQSELITANRQLDERRRFTETVLAGVSAGVIGVDQSGHVTLPNPSALALLESSFDEVTGRLLSDVAPEMAQLLTRLRDNPSESVARGQVTLLRGGASRTLLVRVAREVTANELLGYVVTFDDVTELMAAQRNAAWADIARRIAHEIKNPLTPIQLSAERLKRKYLKEVATDPEVFAQCTDTIIRQVGDIGRMVDEFSAFARMPRPVYRDEDLAQIVRQAVFLQQMARPDLRFESRLPDQPVRLSCDARQIAQVLTNLLQNAVDAIDGRERGPSGDEAAAPLEAGRIVVALDSHGHEAQISLVDNGRGLPPELRDRLFEPYVTTRVKGTGLGLAIVKKIIEEHGGVIWLDDATQFDPALKSGSLARIRLPLAANAIAQNDAPRPDSDSPDRPAAQSPGEQERIRRFGAGGHGA